MIPWFLERSVFSFCFSTRRMGRFPVGSGTLIRGFQEGVISGSMRDWAGALHRRVEHISHNDAFSGYIRRNLDHIVSIL